MTILEPGQWKVRDLVMGPGTDYRVTANSKSFTLTTRTPQSADRPYAHGSMVGAEWANPRMMPITVMLDAPPYTESAWLDALDQLAAAFRPAGSSGEMVELYRNIDGREYVWFGRTRLVDPDTELAPGGYGFVQCAFEAPDPRRYSADLTSQSTGLPVQQGGLTFPATFPATIDGTLVSGRLSLTNSGLAPAPLTLRIDGPVVNPIVLIRRPDRVVQSIEFTVTLLAGQFLQITTSNHLALINGLAQSNQRGQVTAWTVDPFPLQPGTSELRFMSPGEDEGAQITASHRSAWW